MQLSVAVQRVLDQLKGSLRQMAPANYSLSCDSLSGHSVGQHVRHVIELFQALGNGYELGVVNYEKRKRDRLLENDPELACSWLHNIVTALDRPDKPLVLEASYAGSCEGDSDSIALATNYYREIAYNLEHAIHHMALIRIGIREIDPCLELPEEYGIAPATIQYRQQCAQ